MNRLGLIIKREYLTNVAKKSFIIFTLIMPLIFVAIGAVPAILAMLNNNSDVKKVAVVDNTGLLTKAIDNKNGYEFVTVNASDAPDIREYYSNAGGDLYAIVYVPQDVMTSNSVSIFSENTINIEMQHIISRGINKCLTNNKIHQYQTQYKIENLETIIDDCNVDINLHNVKWGKEGSEETSSAEVAMIFGLILAFLTYMFVLTCGTMVMNGVVEEKSNRIVEVIVSSCKPTELMLGKIIGIGLVTLTQFAIWIAMIGATGMILGTTVFAAPDMASLAAAGGANTELPAEMEIWQAVTGLDFVKIISLFVFYFLGGYLLFAAIFAAFGSAVDEPSEAGQFTMPVIMIFIIAFYAGLACMENPDGQTAFWCSMIPFTSPIVMMIRLPYDVPLWQILLSITILYATAFSFVWMAGRIFRRGILHYSKGSWSKILSWLK